MRQHDFSAKDDGGRQWCLHCGALYHEQMTATCTDRADTPAPKSPRLSALDDIDTISGRLAELAAERAAAIASPDSKTEGELK